MKEYSEQLKNIFESTKKRGKDYPDSHFDQVWLRKGQKMEMEHTDNQTAAKNIAKDHMIEFYNEKDKGAIYYIELEKMEKKIKEKLKK